MATTIVDNGASLKITIGTQERNIIKAQIIEISVIKTNIVKIDIGLGVLHNVFVQHSEVTAPLTPSPEALRDTINAMLTPPVTAVTASEQRQIEQIDILNAMKNQLQTIQALVTTLDTKIFFEPLIVDDSGANVLYNGYAVVGTSQESPTWAIERIQKKDGMDVTTWANGSKSLTNSWLDRESLSYF